VLAPNKAADGRAQAAVEAIHASLSGDDHAEALGVEASGVISLCRELIRAGHDPNLALRAYRGATLALIITSIGSAAALRIGRIGFVRDSKYRPPVLAARRKAAP